MNRFAYPDWQEAAGLFPAIKAMVLGILAIVALCTVAHAESPLGAPRGSCSNLGRDFVSISGATGCVRIGGHVRAETAPPRAAPLGYAAEPQDGARHASESFHVRAGADSADATLYRR